MKETTVTKLECMKTIPPPPRGQGIDLMTLVFIPHPDPPATCLPCTLRGIPAQLCPGCLAKRCMVVSPGAMMGGLGGNVVVWETAKLCDYIKVNTIYLHLLSYGLKKEQHC